MYIRAYSGKIKLFVIQELVENHSKIIIILIWTSMPIRIHMTIDFFL